MEIPWNGEAALWADDLPALQVGLSSWLECYLMYNEGFGTVYVQLLE